MRVAPTGSCSGWHAPYPWGATLPGLLATASSPECPRPQAKVAAPATGSMTLSTTLSAIQGYDHASCNSLSVVSNEHSPCSSLPDAAQLLHPAGWTLCWTLPLCGLPSLCTASAWALVTSAWSPSSASTCLSMASRDRSKPYLCLPEISLTRTMGHERSNPPCSGPDLGYVQHSQHYIHTHIHIYRCAPPSVVC